MVNKTIVQGRLVADPERKQTSSGVAYAQFRVAWSKKYKDNETKLFLSCTAWRGTAEMVSKYFSKGSPIIVEGELTTEGWQDQNGNSRSAIKLQVNNVHFCGSKSDGTSGTGYSAAKGDVSAADFTDLDIDDGDLPF